MDRYGDEKMINKYGLVYHMYGIYIDWQLDHNIFSEWGIQDPNGIECFQDLKHSDRWQVIKVTVGGQEMLAIDVQLDHFSYCRMKKLEKTVLADNLTGKEVLTCRADWVAKTSLPVLDQLAFYMGETMLENAYCGMEIAIRGGETVRITYGDYDEEKH